MSSRVMGLPLEYQVWPEFFLDDHESTGLWNGVLESRLASRGVETVLDMTCGTGSQVFFLDRKGYKVTGSDFSPALLERARARALSEGRPIRFLDGDVRTLQVGAFDAVVTMFNAVGHLTAPGFLKAMKNIARNLHPRGIYVFDIFNRQALPPEAVPDLAYQKSFQVGSRRVHGMQCSVVDQARGLMISWDTLMVQEKDHPPRRLSNRFSLKIYTASELDAMLHKAGFEVLERCALDGRAFDPATTCQMLTVARKV